MIQFAAKMYFAHTAGLLTDNITVIIPSNIDIHAREITENYLRPFDVNILYAEPETVYCFERLYYIPTAVRYPNHAFYIMPEDCIFPAVTKRAMKECIVEPYKSVGEDTKNFSRKIYLARRGTYRAMTNWQEAEEFFAGEGFEVIEPHKMSLREKIEYFRSAEFIAGPSSSAFINIVWCRPETKVLIFSNYMRTLEPTGAELAELSGAKITLLTGEDKDKSGVHSPYYIDINKVKEAYSYLRSR